MLMIQYEVRQSIEIGFMMNLTMRSETLAAIKMNQIESLGEDLSSSAHILSDLISNPDLFVNDEFVDLLLEPSLHNGFDLANCQA